MAQQKSAEKVTKVSTKAKSSGQTKAKTTVSKKGAPKKTTTTVKKTTTKPKVTKEEVITKEVVQKPTNEPKEIVKEEVKETTTKTIRKKQFKDFSRKTKLMVVGSCLAVALLGIYIYGWYNVKNKEKYMHSYLLDSGTISLNIQNLDEVNQILFSNETPDKFFVLINYTQDKDTYNLEENLKNIIDNYKLNDSFYYLDVLDIMNNDSYLNDINKAFKTDKITKIPTILYYEGGSLKEVVTRADDNVIKAADFQKILDIYEFEDQ